MPFLASIDVDAVDIVVDFSKRMQELLVMNREDTHVSGKASDATATVKDDTSKEVGREMWSAMQTLLLANQLVRVCVFFFFCRNTTQQYRQSLVDHSTMTVSTGQSWVDRILTKR